MDVQLQRKEIKLNKTWCAIGRLFSADGAFFMPRGKGVGKITFRRGGFTLDTAGARC